MELLVVAALVLGLTILVVWPNHGPGAIVRELARKVLKPLGADGVLDCYMCLAPWMGLATAWALWNWEVTNLSTWQLFSVPFLVPAMIWYAFNPQMRFNLKSKCGGSKNNAPDDRQNVASAPDGSQSR